MWAVSRPEALEALLKVSKHPYNCPLTPATQRLHSSVKIKFKKKEREIKCRSAPSLEVQGSYSPGSSCLVLKRGHLAVPTRHRSRPQRELWQSVMMEATFTGGDVCKAKKPHEVGWGTGQEVSSSRPLYPGGLKGEVIVPTPNPCAARS